MMETGQRRARLAVVADLPPEIRKTLRIRVGGETWAKQYQCVDLDTGRPCGIWHVQNIERFWPTVQGKDMWDPEEGMWIPVCGPSAATSAPEWVHPVLSDDDPFG